jgi:lipid-binding SYLF domain-containing protein
VLNITIAMHLKTRLLSSLALACSLWAGTPLHAADKPPLTNDVKTAIAAFEQADSSMKALFQRSVGYAVFPNVGKGGFVVGGAHGNGLVYEKGQLIGNVTLTQVSIGAQIGGQEFSEVIFFQDAQSLADFKRSQFAMSAQVGAVAAAEGVAQNAKFVDGVAVFTKAKQGLMAEASVGGQKFKFKPLEK